MADSFITSSIVLAEALDVFKNNLRFGNAVFREYSKEFMAAPKIGESFQIENPWRFEVQDGPTINLVDIEETSINMSVTDHKTISVKIYTRDKTLSVDNFRKKYLEDAMIKLANQVDMSLADLYKDVGQTVGTAGSTPTQYSVFGDAAAKLDLMSCPPGNRKVVLDPIATYSMADAVKALHNPQMVEQYVKEGKLTDLIGMGGLYSSQNIKYHTAGTQDGNYVVDGAGQTGASLSIKTGSGTILKGDTFTIAGVYALNPVNYESTGQLMEFAVTADALAGGSQTISISPGIVTSGPTRNVSGSPADGAQLTFRASHKANLAFHEKAFALATIGFDLPETAPVKERIVADGITMTLTGGWDVTNYREIYRLDIIYGVKCIRPEWAVRIMG